MRSKNGLIVCVVSILIFASLGIYMRGKHRGDSPVFIVAAKNRQRKLQILREQQSYKLRYEARRSARALKKSS